MAFRPYLAFAGNCRQAFTRYQEIFGGELVLLPGGEAPPDAGSPTHGTDPELIMHAALTSAVGLLLGADDFSGGYGGRASGLCVNCVVADPGEARRVLDALADGGEVQMPVTETFFAPAFGMCTDAFGIPWQVMVEHPGQS